MGVPSPEAELIPQARPHAAVLANNYAFQTVPVLGAANKRANPAAFGLFALGTGHMLPGENSQVRRTEPAHFFKKTVSQSNFTNFVNRQPQSRSFGV
jgi:hypothetical protein